MANPLRQFRDQITGLLVDNGISKVDAKTYLKTEPSGTDLGNLLYDSCLASVQRAMNASTPGTAIDLGRGSTTLTQVIAPTGQAEMISLSNHKGMDNKGDYYNQRLYFYDVSEVSYEIPRLANKKFKHTENYLADLNSDLIGFQNKTETRYGQQSKEYKTAKRLTKYSSQVSTAFDDAVTHSPPDIEKILGPYYSQPKDKEEAYANINNTQYLMQPKNYYWYTAPVRWNNILFAVQQVADDQNKAPEQLQALMGDSTIVFEEAPTMDTLYLLGAGANGNQENQDLIVNYSDGSSQTYSLSFTDWANNQKQKNSKSTKPSTLNTSTLFDNESLVLSMENYISQTGYPKYHWRYLFGYTIDVVNPVNPSLTVTSLDFNFNDNVKIIAASYV